MRFLLDPETYFLRGEGDGKFSAMVKKTNQQLEFRTSALKLFECAGTWTSLDDFVDQLNIRSVPRERVMRDYEDALIDLNVVGVAKLEGYQHPQQTGCFIAQKRDALALSKFLMANAAKGCSCAQIVNPSYYSKNVLQMRIKQKDDTIVYYERDGRILSAMVFTLSKRLFGGRIVMLESFVADAELTPEEAAAQIGDMLAFFCPVAAKTNAKLRYERLSLRQDWLVSVLEKNGFEQTAVLPEELTTGQTLTLYDRFLA